LADICSHAKCYKIKPLSYKQEIVGATFYWRTLWKCSGNLITDYYNINYKLVLLLITIALVLC